jgi:hypothetical protein
MTPLHDLHLYEEILLLALHDEKGTVHFGASFAQAAGGAILAELLLDGYLEVVAEGKTSRIRVRDAAPPDDPLLAACFDRVAQEDRARSASRWVQRFATTKQLKERVAARLVERRILRREEAKVLLVFSRTVYPERDARPEREVVARLRRAVNGSGPVTPRTVVLLALAHHTGLLKRAVEPRRLKERKAFIEKTIRGEVAGRATREAVQATQAAVMAAVVVPTVVTSAST